MSKPHFFGYGSLVNRATHQYPEAHPATAHGWERIWVATDARRFAFLTVRRRDGACVDGLIAEVPGSDWTALDVRERAYDRLVDTPNIRHGKPDVSDVSIYAVPERETHVAEAHPILLSYLDVVLQGYLREYGVAGAARFLTTTRGWSAPVHNDRADPIYPRHQRLTPAEAHFVDHHLREMRVRFV